MVKVFQGPNQREKYETLPEFETDLLIWKQMQHSGCNAHEPIKLGLY